MRVSLSGVMCFSHPGHRKRAFRTQFGQPQRHAAVDFIQDQDDHQVDDDRRRRHRHAHVGLGLRVGAHGHQGRHRDAVDDDAEDGGKGQTKLGAKEEGTETKRKSEQNRSRTVSCLVLTDHEEDGGDVDDVSGHSVLPGQLLRSSLGDTETEVTS